MKKFTRVLLILAVFIFVIGAGCLVAGLAMGVSSGDLEHVLKRYVPIFEEEVNEFESDFLNENNEDGDTQNDDVIGEENTAGEVYEYEINQVHEIELDLTNVNCCILSSDTDKIKVYISEEKSYITVGIDEDNLEVKCDPNFWNDDETIEITLYIPDSLQLEEFYLTAGAGKIEILTDIQARECFMEMGAGMVNCENIIFADSFEVEIGAGTGIFAMVDAADISLENAAGKTSMTVAGQKEMYNVTMEVTAGKIRYGNDDSSVYTGLTDEYENRPKDATREIEIECAAGSVEIVFENDSVSA